MDGIGYKTDFEQKQNSEKTKIEPWYIKEPVLL